MEFQNILSNYTFIFLLMMVRYIGLFLSAPIFGSKVIPLKVRITLVFFLSVLSLTEVVNMQTVEMPANIAGIVLALLSELSVGFTIGFISFLVFAAIQLAGQFIDLRMGFAMAKVVDPFSGVSSPIMGQFKNTLAILLFFAINGHHILIRAVYRSYTLIPLGGVSFSDSSLSYIFNATAEIFQMAIMIALPVMGTIFVADVIFGFLARTIPQMNIFVIGLPMKMLIGFIVLIIAIDYFIYYMHDLFNHMYQQLFEIIKLLS